MLGLLLYYKFIRVYLFKKINVEKSIVIVRLQRSVGFVAFDNLTDCL